MESLQQLLAVLVVLGLLFAMQWWLRKRGFVSGGRSLANGALLGRFRAPSEGRRLHAIERLPLTATHTLHLVRVADRGILIATSAAGCQVIESAPWESMRHRAPEGE